MNKFPWAKFRTTKAGIKLNTKLDLRTKIPSLINVSNAQKHENATLGEMELNENDTVVFDRGYTNYRQYASFCNTNIWFVSPLKVNVDYKAVNEIHVTDKKIVSDELIQMTSLTAVKNNLPLLTNSMDAEAYDVAEIYRQRWQIELIFKSIKQK
ncbi:MAG: transposase [Treponema sp.]